MSIPVKLNVFEGPLDLLLHLIDINKIDIYDIPISLITDQYLETISQMQELDMEIMSEFLVMAATLLKIKSKMLLPVEEKEENDIGDPRQELIERLLEYKMFKYAALELKDKLTESQGAMFKQTTIPDDLEYVEPPIDLDALVGDMTIKKLHEIFKEVIKKQEDKIDPIRSQYGKIEQEKLSLGDRLAEIENYGKINKRFSFRSLLLSQVSKMNTIVTFLAILELMKSGKIAVVQNDLFEDIEIEMT